jgi:hypothetical protein
VIARIDLPDGSVYVDPTSTYQGGSLRESYLPYRRGLAISEETEELSSIPILRPAIDIERNLSFVKKEDGIELTLSSYFYGREANRTRYYIATMSPKTCATNMKKFYEGRFGPADLVSYDYQDDRNANCIWGTCTILLKDPWHTNREGEKYFFYSPDKFYWHFDEYFSTKRKTPLSLPDPARVRETVSASGLALNGPSETIDHPAFQFTINCASETAAEIELNRELDRLEPEELKEYAKKLREGRNACYIYIYEQPKATRDAIRVAKMLAKP